MLATCERNLRGHHYHWLGPVLLSLLLLHCHQSTSKARFQTCDNAIPRRDIIFIVDQSGTMSANDPKALRWEVLRVVAEFLFRDESMQVAAMPAQAKAARYTQIAILPFGNEESTRAYNRQLKWHTRDEIGELSALLHNWRKRTLHGDTARFSNFNSPFRLLAEARLPWRREAEHYIFFISDGNYNILPHHNNPENQRREERHFENLLAELRRHGDWPTYFIGLGLPGLNHNEEPFVASNRLVRMAQALPLPATPEPPHAYPRFTAPGLLLPNVVTITTKDAEQMRVQLQQQLEHVLRPVRAAAATLTENGSTFPIIDPSWAEITVEVARETTTAALLQNLRVFMKPKNPYKLAREFKLLPAFANTTAFSSYLHTFVVDLAALQRELPEVMNLENLETWGLKSLKPGSIAMRGVSLTIRDNWKITVARCEVVPVPLPRTWWRRLLHQREPPQYQLQLTVHATHLCAASLPQAQLRVRIPEIGEWKIIGKRARVATGTSYEWQFTLGQQALFAKRLGGEINVALEIPELYACSMELPAQVPVHARRLTNALFTGVVPQHNHSN